MSCIVCSFFSKSTWLRSHQALLELPGRLYYKAELQPCAPAALVSGCLQFPGLTDTARGVTPIIVHGVVGQVSKHTLLSSLEGGRNYVAFALTINKIQSVFRSISI